MRPSLGGKVSKDIRSLLTEAVRKRMMGVRRIGCLLSGGLDSSLIAALVVQNAKLINLPYRIQTFAIGMRGSPDLAAARKVAQHLGTDHHEVIFTPEEGLAALKDVIRHNESYDITTTRASVGKHMTQSFSLSFDMLTHFSDKDAIHVTFMPILIFLKTTNRYLDSMIAYRADENPMPKCDCGH